jgi:Uma2 family endonuclease
MIETKTLLTADEFLHSATSKHAELVRGEVVEVPGPGSEHGGVTSELVWRLVEVVRPRRLGRVLVESGFRLFRDPDTVRGPDVSFVAADRIPAGGLPRGYLEGAPTLAVEVLSPSNTAAAIAEKVAEYLAAGAEAVWVMDPRRRAVTVHQRGATVRDLGADDVLTGQPFLPDFRVRVGDLFESD